MEPGISREDVIEFLLWIGEVCPHDIARYAEDEDHGRLAYSQLWDRWKTEQ